MITLEPTRLSEADYFKFTEDLYKISLAPGCDNQSLSVESLNYFISSIENSLFSKETADWMTGEELQKEITPEEEKFRREVLELKDKSIVLNKIELYCGGVAVVFIISSSSGYLSQKIRKLFLQDFS